MRKLFFEIILFPFSCICYFANQQQMASIVAYLCRKYANQQNPKEALCFLFELDDKLYRITSRCAIEYEGNIHPKHRLIKYHDYFCKRIAPRQKVLDVGCGHGALAKSIAEKSDAYVTAIDMSEANIHMAEKLHNHPQIKYLHGNALYDLPEEKHDVVVLSNVLEHIDARVTFLRNIFLTAEARKWLIRVPLFERDWRVPLKKELGCEWRLDTTHYTEYTLESFQMEMQEAGLRIMDMEIRWSEIWCELTPVSQS